MGVAYVETTVLAVSAVAALGLLRWFEGRRRYAASGKGRAQRLQLRSPLARALTLPVAVVAVVVLVLRIS